MHGLSLLNLGLFFCEGKDATKGWKFLADAMEITKEIVQLIKMLPKREEMLDVIKDNLERETDENEEV